MLSTEVSTRLIYVSRLARLFLIGTDGQEIGKVVDVVLALAAGEQPPRVIGFLIQVQRRRVFVGVARIGEITEDGLRLRQAAINFRQFELRSGEVLVLDGLCKKSLQGQKVIDASITPAKEPYSYTLATVVLAPRGFMAVRKNTTILPWTEAKTILQVHSPEEYQFAAISQLHPVEIAKALQTLPLEKRLLLIATLEESRLADVLEEMPEEEQVLLVEKLDITALARILDEMEADDATDLLAEFPVDKRTALLNAMNPDEAAPVRRLLNFAPNSAGGIMTPEPIVFSPHASVAEALAKIRETDIRAPLAAQIFICLPPTETPTGKFLGVVHFQRLLREPPSKTLDRCLDPGAEPVQASTDQAEIVRQLAAYDELALAVVNDQGQLIGAVTIDDVLKPELSNGQIENKGNQDGS